MAQKYTARDKAFYTINYTLVSLFFLIVLYPLVFVISASFSSPEAMSAGRVWVFPIDVTLEGYIGVFNHKAVWIGYMNSLIYMVVGTAASVIVTVFAAYPLSRKDFPGRSFFTFLFAFTMMFSGGLIPTYLLVKSVGLLNTRAAMIIPSVMGVWNVIVARTFFETTIPRDFLDASQIDGASDLRFFSNVVIPLSGPIIAVLSLFYAVGYWNAFFNALIYLNDPKLYPLQMVLRNILIQNEMQSDLYADVEELMRREGLRNLLKYSLIVVASLPVLMIYPFVQRYFVKGIMIGALKG